MSINHRTATNLIKDLKNATADLHQVNPLVGLWRLGVISLCFAAAIVLAWWKVGTWNFYFWTVVAGWFYAFLFVCTHDAVHHTLTGWVWLDEFSSRLIAWPMLWPFGCYSQLHRLHHGWNGTNLQDPERVQWSWEEYQQASQLQRFYVRHQWPIDLFILGGIGLIIKTWFKAWRLKSSFPRLKFQFWLDTGGIALTILSLFALAYSHGVLLQALIFWLLLERVTGLILQTRDHLEHYGLWQNQGQYLLTQLYACRNLEVSPLVSWLMGGLNYHAVHHAFPTIPFNQLDIAFERIQAVLEQYNLPPMTLAQGYLFASLDLSHQTMLIDGHRSVQLQINSTYSRSEESGVGS